MKALVIDNVSKSFIGLQALLRVCLDVEAGEHRLIIGPNGAGKTTLFRIISGIELPTSGAVYFFDQDISRLPMHRRVALGISKTFQIISLFGRLTVLQNITLAVRSFKRVKYTLHRPLSGCKDVFHETERLLKEWELWDKRNTIISNLSYGDQRLLDIMLALAGMSRLLLLDEPTSGLPLAEAQIVASKINDLSREITAVIIEHNIDIAMNLADKVTVLHMGQVVAEGTPAEMKQDGRVREIYLGSEADDT